MKFKHRYATTAVMLATVLGACSSYDLQPQATTDMPSKEAGIGRAFAIAFSDEYDGSKFDLAGHSFGLTYLGQISRTTGGVRSTLYEFAFSGSRITARDGGLTHGNVFMSLSSSPDEDCDALLGARVFMFNVDGSSVPVGRALLTPQCRQT